MVDHNRRKFYRIFYDGLTTPYFRMIGLDFKVLDLSEEGMRIKNRKDARISFSDSLAGALCFQDGEIFLIRGTITRISDDEICLKLKTPLPLRKIVAEQLGIIARESEKKVS